MDDIDTERRLVAIVADMQALIDELVASTPTLGPLSVSSASGRVGVPAIIAILGATSGSTITGTPPDGMAIDSDGRTIAGTPTLTGTYRFALVETRGRAFGSPRQSTIEIIVAPAVGPVRRWTAASTTIRAGGRNWRASGWVKGSAVGAITLSVGPIVAASEGNPSAPIVLTVGPVSPAAEGSGSASVQLSVGPIAAAVEGTGSSSIALSVGAISSQSEGN